jgi:hypothetical protein
LSTYGPKWDQNGEWMRLHNEKLHSLYHSHTSNIVRLIKSRKLRSTGHVARMEEGRMTIKMLTGKQTEMCLTTNHEVAGSTTGTLICLKWIWS